MWCAAQRKRKNKDLMLMLGLNETMDEVSTADNVCWYGHVLRKEDGHVMRKEDGYVMRRTSEFEVESQRKKGRPKMILKKHEEESMKVRLRMEDALCQSKWIGGVNQIATRLG